MQKASFNFKGYTNTNASEGNHFGSLFDFIKHKAIRPISRFVGRMFGYAVQAAKESRASLVVRSVNEVESFVKSGDFVELPECKFSKIIYERKLNFITFLYSHCMKSMEECDETDGIIKLEDGPAGEGKSIFVARCEYTHLMTVEQAKSCGFILPDNISDMARENPELKIKPLMIRCYGVSSSDTFSQLGLAIGNSLAIGNIIIKNRMAIATRLVETFVEEEKRKNYENEVVVPFVTGFSLGGMFASAIALKLHYGSVIFNPLGLGIPGCEFVGKDNWRLASTEHRNQHLAFCTEYDFASSKTYPIRYLVKIPGQIISMKNIGIGDNIHPVETHTEYRSVFAEIIHRKQQKMLSKASDNDSRN